jgi:serine/threonine protein kinase/tetratricopeptide (TPR) repeat protein
MDVAPTAAALAQTTCLTDDDAAALVSDDLDAAQRATLSSHLDACERCRRFVSALAAMDQATDHGTAAQAAAPTLPGGGAASGLRAGDALGRFRLTRPLGNGAMGEVWAARDPELDREVALKLLRLRSDALGAEATTRMRREAQAMARLNHANVVTIYELGTDGPDRVFCAMELVEGATLRRWLETPRAWRAVIDVARAVGRGLAAAHAAGLIHRDIKPENILIADDGRTLVSDFGLAKLADLGGIELAAGEAGEGASSEVLTIAGAVIGTPAYMAPEQLAGRPDPRSDQFSYCVMIYEALFGARPFAGSSFAALADAIARGPDRPAELRGVPRGVLRCLTRGLAADPDARWPSMAALADALDRAARAPRRRRIAAVGLAGVAVLAAGGLGLAGGRGPEVCAAGARILDPLWNPVVRSTHIGRLTALDPAARVSIASATQLVDDWTRSWRIERVAACTVDAPQRAARLDCLDRGLQDLRAQLALWRTGDRGVLEAAVRAAAELPDLHRCVATAPGRAIDPILAAQVTQTDARVRSGRAAEARADVDAMLALAEATGRPRDLAVALASAARAEREVGELVRARDHLARAAREAGRAGDDRTLLDALVDEAAVIIELGQPLVSLGLLDAAQALDERTGASVSPRVHVTRGAALQQAGRTREALAVLGGVLPAIEADAARDPRAQLLLASLLGKISAAQRQLEDYAQALAVSQRQLAIYEHQLGLGHPEVARALTDVASSEMHLSRYADAKRHVARAREIALTTFGEHHLMTGSLHLLSAQIASFEMRLDDARAEYGHARAAFTSVLAADHPRFGIVEAGLGELERSADRCKQAIPHFERSLHIAEVSGHDPRNHALRLIDLGFCLADVGRVDEGRNTLLRAIAELDDLHMDKRWYSEPYAALADLEEAAGRRAQAIELMKKALDALRDDPRPDAALLRQYEQERLDAWTKR